MLGLQGNTSSSKVYRCVACSATFNGLASLLVHQATHASAVSKTSGPPGAQPDVSSQDAPFASKDSSGDHPNPPTLLTDSPSPSFYICDCGEEFQDFSLMLDHKNSHVSQLHTLQPSESDGVLSSGTGCHEVLKQNVRIGPAGSEPGLVVSCPSTSRSPAVHIDKKVDEHLQDDITMVAAPQDQYKAPQHGCEKELENTPATTEQIPKHTMHFQDKTISALSGDKRVGSSKSDTLMKLLASAYMKRFPRPQNQNNTVTPKQEVVPVDVTPGTKPDESQINDLSIAQLRRLLAKPGIQTKSPSIGKILDSSRKKIVPLTITFSPVVVLETRQKLMEPGGNGTYGKYQCGRCRRIFQNLDRLTEHHFLHKKERIKCCRRCKQLIIGRLPFPDNHVCPSLGNKAIQLSSPLKSKSPFPQKMVPFHSLSSTRKVFFCPLCKHSYARRYNLKMHKCQGRQSVLSQQARPSIERMLALRSNSRANSEAVKDETQIAKSIAVGTEVTGRIKVEVTSPSSEQSALSHLAWSNSAKGFSPFLPKSSMMEQQQEDASLCGTSLQQVEENSSWSTAGSDSSEEGQWTMPLDDEMQLHSSTANDEDDDGKKSASVESPPSSLRFFVREGVKRYPCNRCQKTYSRASTLSRHLRLCGFRPRGPGTVVQSGGQGGVPLNTNHIRPMFACFFCGKTFNRKDNMMVHRKRCQLQRTVANVDRETVQQNMSSNATDSQTQEDGEGNWGIMSLPSVLPRRVTCECGVGFTSPRLLLEHLQKHAQESYTCPTCGETVNSWADYEVHLQIHMHPHHQLLKGLQPQRSQPLLLRFQQNPPQQPPAQPAQQPPPPQKRPSPVQLPNLMKKQQRLVCSHCGNTFATRCSLRRHISWDRCKGGRVTNPPKTYHCSHCNSNFPNTISLLFHQRSGACKPPIKPVRCPVCLRWFGTVDGLQKHLLTHKQSESYRCDVCRGTYPNLKSLKNHRRRIHRIMAGDMNLKPQELATSE